MRARKKVGLTALIIALVAAMGLLFAACGGGTAVAGTYTFSLAAEDLAGNTSHNGYLSALGAIQQNTLILHEDKTYEYTKKVSAESMKVELVFRFTGTYTNKGMVVTLKAPVDCEFDEDWGVLTGMLLNSSGKASNGDKVQCKEAGTNANGDWEAAEEHDPLHLFTTPYYLDTGVSGTDVVVTVSEAGSFTYNEVSNPEDD